MQVLIENKTAFLEVKYSKFYSYAFKTNSVKEVQVILENLKKQHSKANHLCFAFQLKTLNVVLQKFSNDHEPAGTAGLPMLTLIKQCDLVNCLIVVVRYFGGVKLGANNLLRTYLDAAKSVIINNTKLAKPWFVYSLKSNYSSLRQKLQTIKQLSGVVIAKENTENFCLIKFKVLKELITNSEYVFLKQIID